jgi:hypothetical protein
MFGGMVGNCFQLWLWTIDISAREDKWGSPGANGRGMYVLSIVFARIFALTNFTKATRVEVVIGERMVLVLIS